MNKVKKLFCTVLVLAMAIGMFSGVQVSAAVSLKSDTTVPFSVSVGNTYQFKITASGKSQRPVLSVANSEAVKVAFNKQVGNDYYYIVTAIGKVGSTSGVYMSLPGQTPTRCCIVTVKQKVAVLGEDVKKYDQSYQHYYVSEYSNDGSSYKMGGKAYYSGLTLKAGECFALYNLDGKYTKLKLQIGHVDGSLIDDSPIEIYLDNKKVESLTIAGDELPVDITVDVTNAKQLELATNRNTAETCPYIGFYGTLE